MIDVRLLTFITLAKHKNYTRAAEELCITQPAVTQHIRYLENYYDIKLIDPSSKKFKLTLAGERFLEYCLHMSNYAKQIEKVLQDMKEERLSIRFGATLSIGGFLLPPILQKIIADNSKVQMSMSVENTEILLEKLLTGEIDCAFVEGYFNKEAFAAKLLKREPFILVVAPGHPLTKEQVVTLESLTHYTLLLREKGSGTRAILEHAIEDMNYSIKNFKNVIEMGSLDVIKGMVKSELGISFMYRTVAEEELRQGTLREIPIANMQLEREFNFVYMKDAILQKQYNDLFDFIKSKIEIG